MDRLKRFQHIKREAKSLHRLYCVSISESDPEKAAEVENVCGVIEQKLLIPMGVSAAFDED